jgi:hypothetical protein
MFRNVAQTFASVLSVFYSVTKASLPINPCLPEMYFLLMSLPAKSCLG